PSSGEKMITPPRVGLLKGDKHHRRVGHHWILFKTARLHLTPWIVPGQRYINVTATKQGVKSTQTSTTQVDRHPWSSSTGVDNRRPHCGRKSRKHSADEPSRFPPLDVSDLLLETAQTSSNIGGTASGNSPGLGRLDATRMALEQRCSDGTLECTHLLGYRGHCQSFMFSCFRQRTCLHHGSQQKQYAGNNIVHLPDYRSTTLCLF